MKKTFFIAAAFLFLSALAFSLDAKVIAVTGKAEKQVGDSWVALTIGEIIQKGTVVSTGFKSEAQFSIGDSKISLSALTRIKIDELATTIEDDTTHIFLDTGTIRSSVKKTEDRRANFQVRSPVAVASVRGTEFDMSAGGTLTVSEGTVSFSPTVETSGSGVAVTKGQTSKVDSQSSSISSPAQEMAKTAAISSDSTTSLAEQEVVLTNPDAATTQSSSSSTQEAPKIIVHLEF